MSTADAIMVSQLLLLVVGVLFLIEMRRIRVLLEKFNSK